MTFETLITVLTIKNLNWTAFAILAMFESSFDAHKYPVVVDIMVLFENKNMSLKMLLARLGRRECMNPFSDHNNYDDGHMFSRIINNEDVFKAPIIDALDGVVLKVA